MGRTFAGLCLLAAVGIALSACSDSNKLDAADPNVFPKDYQRELLNTLVPLLDDPTGVHEAGITEPVIRSAGREPRYVVCVRADARNGNRHYTGVKERIAYFYGGYLNQFIEADKGQCAGVVYKPWPELTNFCLAAKCS